MCDLLGASPLLSVSLHDDREAEPPPASLLVSAVPGKRKQPLAEGDVRGVVGLSAWDPNRGRR